METRQQQKQRAFQKTLAGKLVTLGVTLVAGIASILPLGGCADMLWEHIENSFGDKPASYSDNSSNNPSSNSSNSSGVSDSDFYTVMGIAARTQALKNPRLTPQQRVDLSGIVAPTMDNLAGIAAQQEASEEIANAIRESNRQNNSTNYGNQNNQNEPDPYRGLEWNAKVDERIKARREAEARAKLEKKNFELFTRDSSKEKKRIFKLNEKRMLCMSTNNPLKKKLEYQLYSLKMIEGKWYLYKIGEREKVPRIYDNQIFCINIGQDTSTPKAKELVKRGPGIYRSKLFVDGESVAYHDFQILED